MLIYNLQQFNPLKFKRRFALVNPSLEQLNQILLREAAKNIK